MWKTVSWMVNKTAAFLWETCKQVVQTGITYLNPLTTAASIVTTEVIWHRAITPVTEDSVWLEEHPSIEQALPFLYYGMVLSIYCAFHPKHLKGFAQGLGQHVKPSGLIKAYQQFSDPIQKISKQTILYIMMPALTWHFVVQPTLRYAIPEEYPLPLRLIQGTFWITWQRPTRLLFSVLCNEYYHTAIAKGLYLNPHQQAVSVIPFDQTETFKELGHFIPIPAARLMHHFSKSKPMIKNLKTNQYQAPGKNQGMNDYIRVSLTLIKRLVGYGFLIGITEISPYLNYFSPLFELAIKGASFGYVDVDINFTDTHSELLYICMLAYLYSYSTHEYYFSTLNVPATDQAIIMAENPAFHLAYGLPIALAEYYLVMKPITGLNSEIIYGILFCYFPIMMIQAQSSAQAQHQNSLKKIDWSNYLLPYYWPFYLSGVTVTKAIKWLIILHKNAIQSDRQKQSLPEQNTESKEPPLSTQDETADPKQKPADPIETVAHSTKKGVPSNLEPSPPSSTFTPPRTTARRAALNKATPIPHSSSIELHSNTQSTGQDHAQTAHYPHSSHSVKEAALASFPGELVFDWNYFDASKPLKDPLIFSTQEVA